MLLVFASFFFSFKSMPYLLSASVPISLSSIKFLLLSERDSVKFPSDEYFCSFSYYLFIILYFFPSVHLEKLLSGVCGFWEKKILF